MVVTVAHSISDIEFVQCAYDMYIICTVTVTSVNACFGPDCDVCSKNYSGKRRCPIHKDACYDIITKSSTQALVPVNYCTTFNNVVVNSSVILEIASLLSFMGLLVGCLVLSDD